VHLWSLPYLKPLFQSLFLEASPAGIAEVLNLKGLRAGMNKIRQDTYPEGQQADDQLTKFYFSQQALYKRGRDLNIKNTLTQLYLFCFCHPVFLLPVSLTKYKLLFSQGKPLSIPSQHDRDMVHLQILTLSECC
jgi:hypothetical protein